MDTRKRRFRPSKKRHGNRSNPYDYDLNVLTWDFDEIKNLIEWYLSLNTHLEDIVERLGGVDEVIQESYIDLMKYPPKDNKNSFSCIIISRVRWTISRLVNRRKNHLFFEQLPLDLDHLVYVSENDVNNEDDFYALKPKVDGSLFNVIRIILNNDRLSNVLTKRACGCTLKSISNEYSVTKERIRLLEIEAMQKLQMPWNIRKLIDFYTR